MTADPLAEITARHAAATPGQAHADIATLLGIIAAQQADLDWVMAEPSRVMRIKAKYHALRTALRELAGRDATIPAAAVLALLADGNTTSSPTDSTPDTQESRP